MFYLYCVDDFNHQITNEDSKQARKKAEKYKAYKKQNEIHMFL